MRQNFSVTFKAMGTQVRVWLSVKAAQDSAILTTVPGWFAAWEAVFSRFLPDSELSQLNRQAGRWTPVSASMAEVLREAVAMAALTDGLFNPLILPALESAGYTRSFIDGKFEPGHALPVVPVADWRCIRLEGQRVYLPADARLDLGGIVKGWAAQQTARSLSMIGPCLVDVGGDMTASGSPDERGGWLIRLPTPETVSSSQPVTDDHQQVLLVDSSVATSGITYRRWQRDGETLHHLIDPRTGNPSDSPVLMATVIAPTATHAETFAKAALIGGSLPHLPARMLYRDGACQTNAAFMALIQ